MPFANRPDTASARRSRNERRLLAVALLVMGALLAWLRIESHQAIDALERARLAGQARAVEQNLARQLRGVHAALLNVREDLPGWPAAERPQRAAARLRALTDAVPGLQTMQWVDADGRVRATSQADAPRSGAANLERARARPDAGVLYVSPPFPANAGNPDGPATLELALALTDAEGGLQGLVTATLDPEYLQVVLGSVSYADDMWTAVIHGNGGVLALNPPNARLRASDVARPDTPFTRHLARGEMASFDEGRPLGSLEVRLVAQRTLWPPVVPMDRPLVLSVSRSVDAVYGPWRRQGLIDALLYLVFGAAAWLALLAVQRRRADLERLTLEQQARQAADAERLELALRGADLALWDAHLPSGTSTVNDRWHTMLGYDPRDRGHDEPAWRAMIHPDDLQAVLAAQQAHVEGRTESFDLTYRLRHRDGHWVWVLDRGRVVERAPDGTAVRMVGTHMDVTERLREQEALRRNEESLAITLHSIGDAVIATDAQGRVTRMNATAERLTGWPLAEALGRPLAEVFRIFAAGTDEPAMDPVARVLARGEKVELANGTVMVARDGSRLQVADSAAPIRAAGGAIVGVVLVFSDVTEQYRMMQALRERQAQLAASEQRSRSVLDALISGVVVHGAQGEVLDANPAACRILGTTLERLRADGGAEVEHDFLEEDGTPMPRERYPVNQVIASGQPLRHFVAGIRRPDLAEPLWVYCNALPLHDAQGALHEVVLTLADFSERKAAEEQLRASEARLRMSGRLARLGAWRLQLLPRLRLWLAPEIAAILQSDLALDAARVLRLVTRADRRRWRARIQAVLRGAASFDDEVRVVLPAGGALYLRVLGEPVRDAAGRVVALQGAVQDVTAARLEQQQLRLLEACVERLNDVVVVTEADPLDEPGPRIAFVNPAFERLWGWRREDVLGRSPRFLQGPDTEWAQLERIGNAMSGGQSVRAELQLHAADGAPHWVETEVVPVADAAGRVTHFVAVQRDISDRKRSEALERQLQEAQKMESIGTLAGGIAHDFNNILAAILGNVALARGDIAADHAAQVSLEQINRAALRARNLVQQILTFSRRQPNELRAQPLRPVVEETLSLLRATLPASVRLDTVLADDPLPVEADATQLQQVVMNLCTNAWHALPGNRGRIEVGLAGLAPQAAAALHLPELQPGPCVHLWVADNGTGIDEATRERIFDPFFTTKPVGQGTGLGLSVVHGIVRGHSGAVAVDSVPGQGSTFHVYLPLACGDRDPAGDAAGRSAPAAQAGGHCVLYVDDDEVMVLMVQRLLERAGWGVVACSEPAQALRRVGAEGAAYDVVVTDYNMPEMSGLDLAQQLLRVRPGLPVVITSGYVSDELREQAEAVGVRALLRKENTLEELPALLQRVLGPGTVGS